jgi:hypothetical protein
MEDGTDDLAQQLWDSESFYDDVERRQAAQKACLFGPAPTTAGVCCVCVSAGACAGAHGRAVFIRTCFACVRNRSLATGPARAICRLSGAGAFATQARATPMGTDAMVPLPPSGLLLRSARKRRCPSATPQVTVALSLSHTRAGVVVWAAG